MIPSSVRQIWDSYCAVAGKDRSADFCEAFHFHDNEQGALELAQLVLAGAKRGSASLVWTYEHDGKAPPRLGSLSIMTDWRGTALGIIETRRMEAVPFEDVSAEFARPRTAQVRAVAAPPLREGPDEPGRHHSSPKEFPCKPSPTAAKGRRPNFSGWSNESSAPRPSA